MNRERDFDQTLRNWLDDGADRAPERFVWAALQDVEHTDQRGARWALLEGFLMKIKPAAPILGVAAVVLLAIAMFQFLGGNVGGPDPTPTPRSYSSEELAAILVSERTAPEGLTFARSQEGGVSLVIPLRPGGPTFQMDAFVESLTNYFDGPGTADAYEGYVSWSALFETNSDAERAFDFLVTEHESAEGWGLEPSAADPGVGDESVSYTGAAYDWEEAHVILWRIDNLLLAAVGVGVFDAETVRSLAEAMTDRAS
jgi:hypothetical protein